MYYNVVTVDRKLVFYNGDLLVTSRTSKLVQGVALGRYQGAFSFVMLAVVGIPWWHSELHVVD